MGLFESILVASWHNVPYVSCKKMVLYIIGLGLADEKDITVKYVDMHVSLQAGQSSSEGVEFV